MLAGVRKRSDFDEIEAGRRDGRWPGLRPLIIDVTSTESITAAAEKVSELLAATGQPLVSVVNNAGVASEMVPPERLRTEEIRYVFDVNFFGALETTRAFIPLLRQHQGRVVMISSIAGKLCSAGFSAYCSSKFALEGMSDSLRLELEPFGVSVSVVEPGFIRTQILANAVSRVNDRIESSEEWYRDISSLLAW